MKERRSHQYFKINNITLFILQIFFYVLIFQAGYAQSPTDGLVAYWTFDEVGGTTAQDSSGNNHPGTLFNNPTWVTGRINNAVSFDGINDYVEINDHNKLDLTGGEFTLSAWIYPEAYGEYLTGRIIDHGGGSTGDGGWSLLVNNWSGEQGLRASIKNGNSSTGIYSDINSITLNRWQHVAVTLQLGTITFYVDGQIRGQTTGVPSPTNRAAPVRIGMAATDYLRAFTGVIDEVRIHDRALPDQEIMDLYNQAPPQSDMNPPVISNGQPSGELPLETTTAMLSVSTDEAATCKYSTSPDIPYSSMTDTFSATGVTTHTNPISGLQYIQSRSYYVKCRDQSGNSNPDDYTVSFSFSRTVYSISPSGSDADPGTELLPMKTVQHALNSASGNNSYETIFKVAQGAYYENISIVCCSSRNNWRILGGWNSDFSERDEDPSKTVIDGGGKQRVIKINVPELNLTIEGLTIRNGYDSSIGGGVAVFPFYHATITLNLVNNIIARNISGSAGGGVYVFSRGSASTTTLTLTDNVIAHNRADDYCGGVCVISEDSANTIATIANNTIIDNHAGYHGGGIYIRSYNGATITSTFTNNAVTHNSAAYFGAGVYAYAESGATQSTDIIDNRITGNTDPYFGGGVYLHSVSNATLKTNFTNNTITGNTAALHGGGIFALSALDATITPPIVNTNNMIKNTITDNNAGYDGGGVFSWGKTTLTFANNITARNSASRGAGVFASEGAVLTFKNDTITGNSSAFCGGGVYTHNDSDALYTTTANIINTIIFENTATQDGSDIYKSPDFTEINISYSNVGNVYPPDTYNNLGHNIYLAPRFINFANSDYHLSSSSPLINQGDNSVVSWGTDIDGETRIMYDDKVDIGADEHIYSIIKPIPLPTMNMDGDLSEYAGVDKITIKPSTGENTVTVRAIWADDAIYLAYEVTDTQLNATSTTRDGNVKNDDSVGWAIDTLNNDGGSGDPNTPFMLDDDYQGLVNILNTLYDLKGTPSGTPTSSWNGSWQSAAQFNGTVNDNSDIDTGYTVEVKIPWTAIGFPSKPPVDTLVRIGFLLNDKDTSFCDVDPAGTYIDSENYTGTITQGDISYSLQTTQDGYLGSGYLISSSSGTETTVCPASNEGKQYTVNFNTTGTYKVWMRNYSPNSDSNSIFIGLDGMCAGSIKQSTYYNSWRWSNSLKNGSNAITINTAGEHTVNIWAKETNHLLDGIYLTTGTETPTDQLHGTEINPTNCGTTIDAIWPDGGGGMTFENASNWQEMRLTVLTNYYCDYDHDGYIASLPSNVCMGTECQPIYCQTIAGTDCNDNDFYEHLNQTWYKDSDTDNYSDGITDQVSCTRLQGYKTYMELIAVPQDCYVPAFKTLCDCDDTNEFAYPGAPEIWYNGVDQDCDGCNDYDQDNDSFVHENWNEKADDCSQDIDGCCSPGINDCNDTDDYLNPDTEWHPDSDGDTFGNPTYAFVQCSQPSGPPVYVLDNQDCDDNDINIYHGGPSVRVLGVSLAYYFSLQEAYAAASSGESIQCKDTTFTEHLSFDLSKTVYIEGGYDCAYSDITGSTTVTGDMLITDGSVTVEYFEIQMPSLDWEY
ncbi:hypothetical protein C4544_05050 [candidate division WS5 bacterium]|uniref:LamG-like jellyroll fold domain-containing protein n=1 Tax=candidate division WS5 bacterium TaxID=2093353 RepID=A0A419DB76_9BACT|nr:MAG: hypothetical protein C4544_05050 [candidate division WS5 bacterium]